MIGEPDDDKFGDFIKSNVLYMNDEQIAKHKPVLFTKIKKRAMKLATKLYRLPEIMPVGIITHDKLTKVNVNHRDSFHFKDARSKSFSMVKGQPRTSLHARDRKVDGRLKSIWQSSKNSQNMSLPLKFNREAISEEDSVEEILNKKRITIPDRAYLVRKLNMTYKEILEKHAGVDDEGIIKVVDTGITPIKGRFLNLATEDFWERSTRKHLKFKNFISKVNKKYKFEKKQPKTQLEKFFLTVNKPKDHLDEYIKKNFPPDFTIKDPTLSHRKIKVSLSLSGKPRRLPNFFERDRDLALSPKASNHKLMTSDLSATLKREFGVSLGDIK